MIIISSLFQSYNQELTISEMDKVIGGRLFLNRVKISFSSVDSFPISFPFYTFENTYNEKSINSTNIIKVSRTTSG